METTPMPDTASASADSSSAACGAGVVLDLTVLLGLMDTGKDLFLQVDDLFQTFHIDSHEYSPFFPAELQH